MQIAQREEILRRLALGETLRGICRSDPDLPSEVTVREWAGEEPDTFGTQYERARMHGYQSMADELVEASRQARIGRKSKFKRTFRGTVGMTDDQINEGLAEAQEVEVESDEYDAVDRARLHVDTLKWLMSKALPKMYGDKMSLTPPDPTDDDGSGYAVTFHKLPHVPKP